MITGLNHITLAVSDVDTSFAFYRDILGFKPLARWPQGAYFLAGNIWLALQKDGSTRKEALPEYTHVAFTVARDDMAAMTDKLKIAGAGTWQENWTEGDSVYFTDPDGHKLELHASDLKTRLQTAREKPWPGLEFFD